MIKIFPGLFQQQFNQLSSVVVPPADSYSYVAYYPSWATEGFGVGDTVTTKRKPSNIPDYFTHCFIAFARPDITFDKNAPDLAKAKTGLDFPNTPAELKDDLAKLRARGVKTFISIGGATYGRPDIPTSWAALVAEAKKPTVTRADTPIIKSISEFIQYFNIDGCDLDFEDDPAYWANNNRVQYLEGYYYLLKAMDMARKDAAAALGRPCLVGSACWSTGWDQTAPTKADANTYKSSHNLVSYWGDRAGRERQVFSGFTASDGQKWNATQFVDVFVNMTYDFGPQTINTAIFYDPIQAYKECRECVTDASKVVTLGICPEPFGWGQAKMMVLDSECAPAGGSPHATRLTNDQYQRSLDKPFSVEDHCNRFIAASTLFKKDGFILWSVYAVAGTYTYNSKPSANATTASRKISSMLKIGTDTTKIIHR